MSSFGPSIRRLSFAHEHAPLLGAVAFVNGTAVSDVVPFRTFSNLQFQYYLPHVVSYLLPSQVESVPTIRCCSSDDSFLHNACLLFYLAVGAFT